MKDKFDFDAFDKKIESVLEANEVRIHIHAGDHPTPWVFKVDHSAGSNG